MAAIHVGIPPGSLAMASRGTGAASPLRPMPERFPVAINGDRITAIAYTAAHPLGMTLVLGHGVSGDQRHPFIVEYATGLARRGVLVVTYNFPFAEHGRRPRIVGTLEACCRAAVVAAHQCRPSNHLFIGGKSLGGRIASRVAAEGGRRGG